VTRGVDDKDKRVGTEEALYAKVRALTAEVSKLRRELETTLRSGKKPTGRAFAPDRTQRRHQSRTK
jgi:hypothetical protein